MKLQLRGAQAVSLHSSAACRGKFVPFPTPKRSRNLVVFDDLPTISPDAFSMSDCALIMDDMPGTLAAPLNQPGFKFVQGAIAAHIPTVPHPCVMKIQVGPVRWSRGAPPQPSATFTSLISR
jgi:hypothetical protein